VLQATAAFYKKAQLTLRATALSFQDGGRSKMAVSHHLGYYRTGNSAILSPIPKTLAYNQTWSGSDAPFARYLPLNYTVTLKLGFGVTQGHRKLYHEIGRPRKPHTRTKHHVDRQSGCEVMALFVCPRWPSAAILDLVDPQISPFNPPTS